LRLISEKSISGERIECTNLVTLAISGVTLTVCLLGDRLLAPWLAKKCRSQKILTLYTVLFKKQKRKFLYCGLRFRFPIPTQLFLISLFTPLSTVFDLKETHHVRLVNSTELGQWFFFLTSYYHISHLLSQ
jgi:hypothetical protein